MIGGAVALLNNPRSGKENREILSKQIQEVTQDITVINTEQTTLQRGIKELQEVIVPQTMEVVNSIQEKSQNSNWKTNHALDGFKTKFKHCKHTLKKWK